MRKTRGLVRLFPFALAIAVLFAACTKVPVTGRKQLNFIPDSQILSMSYQQYDQFLAENKLSDDAEARALVERVGERIKGAVETYFAEQNMSDRLDDYAWEFHLVQSDEANAWCMPGGKVVFYEGIMPICKDETGVAVVMGHEVAHAVAEHGAERMSQGLLVQMGGLALSEALHSEPEKTQQLWMTAFAVGAQYGALLPYSRLQESEADRLGLIFMALAGYDPHAAVAFWERMRAASGGAAPPEFLSTHPSNETRIADLKKHMDEALRYYRR
jgi:predicted Zn-dependent protease